MIDVLFIACLAIVAEAGLMLILLADKVALKKQLDAQRAENEVLMRYLKPAPRNNIFNLKTRV